MTKTCSRCEVEKSIEAFHKSKHGACGRRADCKECVKVKSKAYYKKNKEKIKKEKLTDYYANKDVWQARHKKWYEKNPHKHAEYHQNSKNKRNAYSKKRSQSRKEQGLCVACMNPSREGKVLCADCNEKASRKATEKYNSDVGFRLRKVLRRRFLKALKGNYKSGSAVRDLGCSIPEFKKHIEKQFQPGMTWENHGLHGWHLDHIKPLAAFDLTDREQVLEVCHYTNIQPLWAEDNFKKGGVLFPF